MKVYVVMGIYDREGGEPVAAFATREKATELKERMELGEPAPGRKYAHDWASVVEMEVQG